jgi:hypothetical protein
MWVRFVPRFTAMLVAAPLIAGSSLTTGSPAQATESQSGISFGPLSTFGSPFSENTGLTTVMNAGGEVALAWDANVDSESALGRGVESARIAPDGTGAGPVRVTSGAVPTSQPVLALSAAGRATVAWFEERATSDQYIDEILALRARDALPGGRMEAPQTVWRPPRVFRGGQTGLAVASDPAGDEVLAWLTRTQKSSYRWTVMVSSRRASGAFTAPVALTSEATEVSPAVAMSPNGEATVLWPGPDAQQVLASTWPAGNAPAAAAVLDRYIPTGPLETFERFRDLQIRTDAAGDELATWLFGLSSVGSRPHAVALRAAWRLPRAGFGPTQTVSSPDVEAREPALALSPDGRALLAWSEITSSGLDPQVSYATASPGGAFNPAMVLLSAIGEEPGLAAALLPDGSALLSWHEDGGIFAARWSPGRALPIPTFVARLGELGSAIMAAGGVSDPVFAWIRDSGLSFFANQVQYVIANGLDGPVHPVVAPVLALTANRNLKRQHGLLIVVRCSERCRLVATAHIVALRKRTSASGSETDDIGSFLPLHRQLPGSQRNVLRLESTAKLLRAYCRERRHRDVKVEARLSVRGLDTGAIQAIVLGDSPGGASCAR